MNKEAKKKYGSLLLLVFGAAVVAGVIIELVKIIINTAINAPAAILTYLLIIGLGAIIFICLLSLSCLLALALFVLFFSNSK